MAARALRPRRIPLSWKRTVNSSNIRSRGEGGTLKVSVAGCGSSSCRGRHRGVEFAHQEVRRGAATKCSRISG
jgi:hypothetical protein